MVYYYVLWVSSKIVLIVPIYSAKLCIITITTVHSNSMVVWSRNWVEHNKTVNYIFFGRNAHKQVHAIIKWFDDEEEKVEDCWCSCWIKVVGHFKSFGCYLLSVRRTTLWVIYPNHIQHIEDVQTHTHVQSISIHHPVSFSSHRI